MAIQNLLDLEDEITRDVTLDALATKIVSIVKSA